MFVGLLLFCLFFKPGLVVFDVKKHQLNKYGPTSIFALTLKGFQEHRLGQKMMRNIIQEAGEKVEKWDWRSYIK